MLLYFLWYILGLSCFLLCCGFNVAERMLGWYLKSLPCLVNYKQVMARSSLYGRILSSGFLFFQLTQKTVTVDSGMLLGFVSVILLFLLVVSRSEIYISSLLNDSCFLTSLNFMHFDIFFLSIIRFMRVCKEYVKENL